MTCCRLSGEKSFRMSATLHSHVGLGIGKQPGIVLLRPIGSTSWRDWPRRGVGGWIEGCRVVHTNSVNFQGLWRHTATRSKSWHCLWHCANFHVVIKLASDLARNRRFGRKMFSKGVTRFTNQQSSLCKRFGTHRRQILQCVCSSLFWKIILLSTYDFSKFRIYFLLWQHVSDKKSGCRKYSTRKLSGNLESIQVFKIS